MTKLLGQIVRVLKRYQREQPDRYEEYAQAIRYIKLVCYPKAKRKAKICGNG